MIETLRDRETTSMEIKPKQDKDDMEIEAFGDGFDNEGDENRAENRPMTDKEKAALDRWKQEDEELDGVIGEIDGAMDELLAGIGEFILLTKNKLTNSS